MLERTQHATCSSWIFWGPKYCERGGEVQNWFEIFPHPKFVKIKIMKIWNQQTTWRQKDKRPQEVKTSHLDGWLSKAGP